MDISMSGPGLSLPVPLPLPPPLQNGLSELAHILSQLPHGVMGMGALIAPNGEVNMDAVNGEWAIMRQRPAIPNPERWMYYTAGRSQPGILVVYTTPT